MKDNAVTYIVYYWYQLDQCYYILEYNGRKFNDIGSYNT